MTVSNEDRKEHGFLAYIRQLRTMGSCVTHMTEIIAKTPAELRWRSGSNSWFEPDMYSKLSLRNQNVNRKTCCF